MDWFSIFDRLPDTEGDYLVYDRDAGVVDVSYFDEDRDWYMEGISHWMPLPPPPDSE